MWHSAPSSAACVAAAAPARGCPAWRARSHPPWLAAARLHARSSPQDTVLFVGRLPGDQVATTPCDYDAWWLRPGEAFISHPLGQDVAWEAVVNTSTLGQDSGYRCVGACGGLQACETAGAASAPGMHAPALRGVTRHVYVWLRGRGGL